MVRLRLRNQLWPALKSGVPAGGCSRGQRARRPWLKELEGILAKQVPARSWTSLEVKMI